MAERDIFAINIFITFLYQYECQDVPKQIQPQIDLRETLFVWGGSKAAIAEIDIFSIFSKLLKVDLYSHIVIVTEQDGSIFNVAATKLLKICHSVVLLFFSNQPSNTRGPHPPPRKLDGGPCTRRLQYLVLSEPPCSGRRAVHTSFTVFGAG